MRTSVFELVLSMMKGLGWAAFSSIFTTSKIKSTCGSLKHHYIIVMYM